MPTDDWKCSCGKMNPSYVTTCTCGVQRDDVLTDDSYAQEIGVDLEEEARKKEGERKEYERLRNQAMRFVNCPKCGSRLKQIGRCLNAHDLGLYKCPACDKM